jgi:hypothetical protein
MRPPAAALPIEGQLPLLDGATGWLNSPPLTANGLRGHPVLVVLGVHTPEFAFERTAGNVRRAVRDLRVGYPVATDNEYAIWHAFGNLYWPARYFVDAQGRIRHHQFGEGGYEESGLIIQQLLAGPAADAARGVVSVHAQGVEAPADWADLESPENCAGHERTENFALPGGIVPGERHGYSAPVRLRLNHWALSGDWTVDGQAAALNAAIGRIAYRFHARDLHLVMGPATVAGPVRFRVLIDGQPPGPDHGLDVDGQGTGRVAEQRLYQLIRQRGPVGERTFEITFLDPGVQAYSVTFG